MKHRWILLLLAMPLAGGCACRSDSSGRGGGDPAGGGPPFLLTVQGPAPTRTGEKASAEVKVVPRGRYKVNLEFPTSLAVKGPAAATPRELVMRAKDAARLTESELLLRPGFVLGQAGTHAFKGTLRFSVCTDELCEIKEKPVKWMVSVRQ